MNFYSEILKYKDELIKDLVGLVQIPSVLDRFDESNLEYPFGKDIRDALDYMLNLAKRDGFLVKNINNYAGHIEYGKGDELIAALGHLDVVPATGIWSKEKFGGEIIDGKIYGRGTQDDKGPTIACYYALKMLKDLGLNFSKRFRLILGCDEESGSRCVKKYFENEEMPSFGFAPDANFPLINGEKGIISFDIVGEFKDPHIEYFKAGDRYNIVPDVACAKLNIDLKKEFLSYLKKNNYEGEVDDDVYTIKGKASHAMAPDKGINAISLLAKFLNKYLKNDVIKLICNYLADNEYGKKLGIDCYDEEMKHLTMNLAKIDYEDNEFKIGLNFRIPKIECVNMIKEGFAKVLNDFYLIQLNDCKVHYVPSDDNDVTTLLNAYKKYTGDVDAKAFTIGGGTYAQSLTKGVAFGAMFKDSEETEHMPDEYMKIDDILKAAAIYAEAIWELCK